MLVVFVGLQEIEKLNQIIKSINFKSNVCSPDLSLFNAKKFIKNIKLSFGQ